MTPYVSIDIETTGLDYGWCQVIEVGAVIDDWKTPVEDLPTFHCYVSHERIVGEPFALAMNAEILRRIANREKLRDQYDFLAPGAVTANLAQWLNSYRIDVSKVLAAGKNFSSFDKQFLERLPHFRDDLRFHHRSIDPCMLFWRPGTDAEPPSSKTCMERAGIAGEVAHTAVEDAIAVIKMVRYTAEAQKPMTGRSKWAKDSLGMYVSPSNVELAT